MPKLFITEQNKSLLFIPFFYALASRYHWPRDFIVNAVTAWVPGIILVYCFTDLAIIPSVGVFLLGYIVFICIYEIGYIANDTYGLLYDPTPRARVSIHFDARFFVVFVLCRLAVFLGATFMFDLWSEPMFWVSYMALAAVLILHNTLKKIELKFLTFLQLSTLRFCLPVLFCLEHYGSAADTMLVISLAIFTFVYPRFITYLDAKGRLDLPERKFAAFPMLSLLVAAPIVAVLTVFSTTFAPLFVWIWLCVVQVVYLSVTQLPVLKALRTRLGFERRSTDTVP